MRFFENTKILREIQDKTLRVYVETRSNNWHVIAKDYSTSINEFSTKQDAFDFCRILGLELLGVVKHK